MKEVKENTKAVGDSIENFRTAYVSEQQGDMARKRKHFLEITLMCRMQRYVDERSWTGFRLSTPSKLMKRRGKNDSRILESGFLRARYLRSGEAKLRHSFACMALVGFLQCQNSSKKSE